ncbi:hypothetical protein [Chroococcidiopsis sp.]|uniref:hypothetical protein n=1 Tax=Chroococcidiopsis sp. TaxID=3088168 RepID=UPI003F3BE48A
MTIQYNDTTIISSNEGKARLKGLDLNFTSATKLDQSNTFGQEIISADTGKPVRLSGKPTYDTLTLRTPNTVAAQKKIQAWLKTADAKAGAVACTAFIQSTYYTFTQASISRQPIFPGFDNDSDQTTANMIEIDIEVTNNSRTQVEFGK